MFFSFQHLLFVAPAMLLMVWAQWRIHSTYRRGLEVPARLSGAAAARHILDRAGLHDVAIEQTSGMLSDHYDPSSRVIRLSGDVYQGTNASAVGIAAHEAGHALQHAENYGPLVVRNAAVPAAQFGPMASIVLIMAGAIMAQPALIWVGIVAFGAVVFFQLVNLPVEFDASTRAKQLLPELGIVDEAGAVAVTDVLNAAAWTYVAATLESVLTLVYYVLHLTGGRSDE